VGFGDPSSIGINSWYKEMNVLNITINIVSSSIAKRKGKDMEIVKSSGDELK
jgi:hypothetical protein